jgi:hypothetical protein
MAITTLQFRNNPQHRRILERVALLRIPAPSEITAATWEFIELTPTSLRRTFHFPW